MRTTRQWCTKGLLAEYGLEPISDVQKCRQLEELTSQIFAGERDDSRDDLWRSSGFGHVPGSSSIDDSSGDQNREPDGAGECESAFLESNGSNRLGGSSMEEHEQIESETDESCHAAVPD